eukprot:5100288-Prymnesium_polylepis.1
MDYLQKGYADPFAEACGEWGLQHTHLFCRFACVLLVSHPPTRPGDMCRPVPMGQSAFLRVVPAHTRAHLPLNAPRRPFPE